VRLGRIHRGMMVNMHVSNAKLRKRAEVIVSRIAGCDLEAAQEGLAAAGGEIKLAVLLVLGVEPEEARLKLAKHGHNLRQALADIG
jgi:N-acetylmuramic acid 6-phosphate etherase